MSKRMALTAACAQELREILNCGDTTHEEAIARAQELLANAEIIPEWRLRSDFKVQPIPDAPAGVPAVAEAELELQVLHGWAHNGVVETPGSRIGRPTIADVDRWVATIRKALARQQTPVAQEAEAALERLCDGTGVIEQEREIILRALRHAPQQDREIKEIAKEIERVQIAFPVGDTRRGDLRDLANRLRACLPKEE